MNGGVLGKAAVPACIAYSVLLHLSILRGVTDSGHLLLLSLPLIAGASWALLRSVPARWRVPVLLALAVLVCALVQGQHLRAGMIAADGMWHASMNLFLLWLFGRTLAEGRVPLVSQLARHFEGGELSPALAAYTRKVTIAWALFFAAQLLTSALLCGFAPLPVWSLFINVLNAPLIALMFAGEYVIRIWRHPGHARASVAQVVDAFTRNLGTSRSEGR
jgi:uncharacterized membrane protein